jgi:hypothetical protein
MFDMRKQLVLMQAVGRRFIIVDVRVQGSVVPTFP